MKKIFLFIQVCLLTLVFASCSDDDDDEKLSPPTIKLNIESVETTSVTFNVSSTNAERCFWLCQTVEETQPSIDDVMKSGKVINLKTSTIATIEDLSADTEYAVYAVAQGEGGETYADPLKIRTNEEETGPYVETNVLVEATYRTDNAAGAGQYSLVISNAEPASSGDPEDIGDIQLFFDLFNVADSDPMNAILPSGVYKPASDYSAFTWNPAKSMFYTRVAEGDNGLSPVPFIDGTVKVSADKGQYIIKIDATLLSGEAVKFSYKGDIQFVQTGTANERFTEDQNVKFEFSKNSYYGNWFRNFADDLNLQFYTGKIDKNGKQTEGYYLSVPTFMEKVPDPYSPDIRLQEGVYTIIDRQLNSTNTIPMILQKGEHVNLFGDYYDVGTYLTHINGQNGRKVLGLCVEGTMTVKHVGENYKIDFDFITEEGVSIKGVYEGELKLNNKCDNKEQEPKRPWSTLKKDHQLMIPEDATAEAYLMGDYLYPGLNSWIIIISPTDGSTPGDMVTTEIFTAGETLELGRYEVKKEFKPFHAIPGFIEFQGNILYTWFGDMADLDEEGYAKTLGPISSGAFDLSQESGDYKFVFDFVDDAGNKINGDWNGQVKLFDVRQNADAKTLVIKRAMSANIHL